MNSPFTIVPDGLLLAVRVTARAKRSEVVGHVWSADGLPILSVRLAAPPVDGAANKALRRLVADLLGVAASAVTIQSGETSRSKRLFVAGDCAALAARLAHWIVS